MVQVTKQVVDAAATEGASEYTFTINMTSDEFWDLAMLCIDDTSMTDEEHKVANDILEQGRPLHHEVEEMMKVKGEDNN